MSEIIQMVISWDISLFHFFNTTIANSFLDTLMPFITNKSNWYIPLALFWFLLMVKGGKTGRTVGILMIIILILNDQITNFLLKPTIGRLRPCKVLENFRLLVHCGGKYSFPSGHASNVAAIATLLSYYFRTYRWLWLVIAFLVGFSRIYVGVHYPLDVLGGWLVGFLIAYLIIKLYNQFQGQSFKIRMPLNPN